MKRIRGWTGRYYRRRKENGEKELLTAPQNTEKVRNSGEIKGITSEDVRRRFIINRRRRCRVDYREKTAIWPCVSDAVRRGPTPRRRSIKGLIREPNSRPERVECIFRKIKKKI